MRKKIIAASSIALLTIAIYEGYSERAYNCPAGIPTIGYGTTHYEDGTPVHIEDRITHDRAVMLLRKDAERVSRDISACIGDVPLHQHEFDAFVSLAYNIGSDRFCRSSLLKRLKTNPPDYAGACREILRWDRAAGMRLSGLTKRRQAEYQMCIGAKDATTNNTK
ncbi:MAG: lysozyme [Deltaproteobacteria bacterium]|nr:lysozyme [Deltaproteobacteria bacterium]